MTENKGTVLVTRPAGKADKLLARLQALNYRTEYYPLLTLESCTSAMDTLPERLAGLPVDSLVISISRPASELACSPGRQS